MREQLTRREAVKIGLSIAAGASVLTRLSRADSPTKLVTPVFQAFVTDQSGHRYARFDRVFDGGSQKPAAIFSIDRSKPLQEILGFGAALTDAACTVLSQLTTVDRANLLDECYSPSKNNFSVGRLCIGASDYSTELYSYDEGAPDPTLSRFSIDHDRIAVLPLLRQARAIRPDLFLFAAPWSPPGWMKYGNSMKGGSIRPGNLDTYARYIIRYLTAYAETGMPVDAITIQNELDADQYGAMPACTWSEELEASYIVDHLGPLLMKNDLRSQLWILDHNYDLSGRVIDQLEKPNLRKLVKGVAWHGYVGNPNRMMEIKTRYPEMDMHWTEGGDDFYSKDLETNWVRWSNEFAEILNNGARSITTWNLALDENGKPNIGPFHCAGMLTINSHSQEITRNGIYWALSHYSQAFVRGSRILKSEPQIGPIKCVAANRPDGSLAVVLTNKDKAATTKITTATGISQQLSLPANSVVTVLLS